jgi:hypothetical protein
MKIGIVSCQKHCKTHLRQLKQDGHEVYCLGAKPDQIPSSYDALIVRIASMRHCDSYKEWGKSTGRPVIYEDGLSGIRRELAKIADSTPKMATAAISVQEVRDRMVEWGAALIEARPQDNRSTIARHLTATLTEQFPSLSSNPKALVSGVVGELFNTSGRSSPQPAPQTLVDSPKDTASAADPVVPEPSVPIDYPTPLRPFPSPGNPWCKVYTEAKLQAAYLQAVEYLGVLTASGADSLTVADLCSAFKKAEKGRRMPRTVATSMKPHVRGKPLKFVMIMYLALPEDHSFVKKALNDAYLQITGKGSDTRLWKPVEWFLGREQPIHKPTIITPPETKTGPQGLLPGEALPALPDAFSPNTTTRTPTVAAASTEPLMDNTQTIVGLLDTVERMEGQIKTLEAGLTIDPEGDAHYLWKERFAAMREELRSDISTAFDALAAEQQAPGAGDLSSNPFAAIEQVKALLKEAGFTGSLTLTIE